jgi:hypothetical protein
MLPVTSCKTEPLIDVGVPFIYMHTKKVRVLNETAFLAN